MKPGPMKWHVASWPASSTDASAARFLSEKPVSFLCKTLQHLPDQAWRLLSLLSSHHKCSSDYKCNSLAVVRLQWEELCAGLEASKTENKALHASIELSKQKLSIAEEEEHRRKQDFLLECSRLNGIIRCCPQLR